MIRGSDCTKLSGVLYQAVTPHTAARALDRWLAGRALEDASLAAYLAHVFESGRAASTAAQAVKAANFRAKLAGQPPPAGERTARVMAGYRRMARRRLPCIRAAITPSTHPRAAATAADSVPRPERRGCGHVASTAARSSAWPCRCCPNWTGGPGGGCHPPQRMVSSLCSAGPGALTHRRAPVERQDPVHVGNPQKPT